MCWRKRILMVAANSNSISGEYSCRYLSTAPWRQTGQPGMDGTEKVVKISGDLSTIQNYTFTVAGSPNSQSLIGIMSGLFQRQVSADDIATYVDTVSNPELGAFVAYRSLGASGQFWTHRRRRWQSSTPGSETGQEYAKFISSVERQYQSQMVDQLIKVGQPAPDITLPSPNGKEYSSL